MPLCKKCENYFPNRIFIDEKEHLISHSRTSCFDCSPFNVQNEYLTWDSVCKKCDKHYLYSRKKGDSKSICGSCKTNKHRQSRKIKCVEYKGGSCLKCKYNMTMRALDFHHINPKDKKFQISGSHCISWEKVKEELDKCVLLCNRCHSEVEDNLWTIDDLLNEANDSLTG